MGNGKLWIPVIAVAIFSISLVSISAEEPAPSGPVPIPYPVTTKVLPAWVDNIFVWYGQGIVSETELLESIKWLVENKVIKVSSSDQGNEYLQNQLELYKDSYHELEIENDKLKAEIAELRSLVALLGTENSDYGGESYAPTPEPTIDPTQFCYGRASCFVGTVTSITDGDTINVDSSPIRFALVDTPELGNPGSYEARDFIEEICPVGSTVVVDEDDEQTSGSYGRMVAVIHCHDTMSLNEAVLIYDHGWISKQYCSNSEFGSHSWAIAYGCGGTSYTPPAPKYTPPSSQTTQPSCDPSYPDVCIPPYPPDLDCGEISYKNFRVTGSDPHGFDGDNDGIGCES